MKFPQFYKNASSLPSFSFTAASFDIQILQYLLIIINSQKRKTQLQNKFEYWQMKNKIGSVLILVFYNIKIYKVKIQYLQSHRQEMQNKDLGVKDNYDQKARLNQNQLQRQFKPTSLLLKFNNWIKSVLIAQYAKQMAGKVERILDIPKDKKGPILHVFDIGCGRGQDIKKWRLAKVRYMIANDFSEQCVKSYIERWRKQGEPYKLYTTNVDFTKLQLYSKIQHAYFDIVTAQLCFHYMFKTKQGLQYGLASILSNLLVGGVFIATIPDAYSILRKINEKGKKIDGHTYYGNKYFSLKFQKTTFSDINNNQYGFYQQDSVGAKNEVTGEIQYTNQWLISLDKLQQILKAFGVQIEDTKNFLQYYLQYRDQEQYKKLMSIMGLKFEEGQSMDPQLWQIAHLYRVLVCRKTSKGKTLNQYTLQQRFKAEEGKQIKRTNFESRGDRGRSFGHSGHHNNNNRSHSNYHSNNSHSNYHSNNKYQGNNRR